MRVKLVFPLILTILMVGSSLSLANPPHISTIVNNFVSKIYPKGSHYHWIINDATAEAQQELILDINTALRDRIGEEQGKGRFLLLIVNGKLLAAQRIPLGAEVDCGNEEEV